MPTAPPPLPSSLYIETTSRCNSLCETCILTFGGREAPNAVGGMGADSLDSVLRLSDLEVSRLDDDIVMTGYPIKR